MRSRTFGLVICIIVCILLLFSILLFAHPAGPSDEYPIVSENSGALPTSYQAADETDMLIDNGNGTVSLLLHPVSYFTGKNALYRIDNVSVTREYSYTTDGKKVITDIKLTAVDPTVDGSITLLKNGDGNIRISLWLGLGYYESDGYIRHPLDIKPAIESNEVSMSLLYPPVGKYGNESAGIVSKLVPLKAGDETVYVQGYEQHVVGPAMLWEHTYGNGSVGVILKTDDGYLLAGKKEIQVTGPAGIIEKKDQAWLGKVDDEGTLTWERFYNGSSIQALLENDGDYVATGNIDGSLWLLETDKSGNVLADHSYNNSSYALSGVSIALTGDEDYMIMGNSNVIRADKNLSIIWNKDLSKYGITYGNTVIRTKDGDFVVSGGEDGNIAKIDVDGSVLWNTTAGEHAGLLPVSLCPTGDGGLIAAYLDVTAVWPQGITVTKLTPDGTTEWSNTYYGAGAAYVSSMSPAGDGDYVISGYTNGFASGRYVLKIDSTGNAIWSALYDQGAVGPIVQSDDGGYLIAASSGPQIELIKLSSIIR